MQFQINIIMEFIALIFAIVNYRYLRKGFMKWVVPFLLIVFSGEVFSLLQYRVLSQSSTVIQYFIGIAESIFYGYIFYRLSNKNGYKKGVLYFIFGSVSFYLIGLIFYARSNTYFFSNLIVSGFFLAIFALIFIYLKFVDDDSTILVNEPGFWIAFGVSLFFAGTSIVFSLYDFIVKNNLTVFGIRLYNFIPRILCVVLYSSISYAIILCKKKTRVSL